MHDTAYRIGGLVVGTYLPSTPARILEVGAQNVNGTLRDHAPRNAKYVGLDFEAGDGVDIVVAGLDDWSVPDAYFDLVMASSVFEHDKAFWRTFLAMCEKTKPGGHIYISAPSNGTIHRYPKDYWRFYPDAGLALEEWARSQAFDVTLVESFVAERETDVWNDFCAVFRVGPSDADLNRDFVYTKVATTNALTWRSSKVFNPFDDSEDTRLLGAAHEETRKWIQHVNHLDEQHVERTAAWASEQARLTLEIEQHARRIAELDANAAAGDAEVAVAHDRADALQRELDRLNAAAEQMAERNGEESSRAAANLGALQSRLVQREEEAAQAWAAAETNAQERDRVITELDTAHRSLVDANDWVARLALNRAQMERQIVTLDAELAKLTREIGRVRRENGLLEERVVALSTHDAAGRVDAVTASQSNPEPAPTEPMMKPEPERETVSVILYQSAKAALEESRIRLNKAHSRLSKLDTDLPIIQSRLSETESTLFDTQRRLDETVAAFNGSQSRLDRTGVELGESRTRLERSWNEIALLSTMLTSAQDRIADLENQNAWLREAGSFLMELGKWWWRFMPIAWQRRKRARRLQRRGLFDADSYLASNADVAASGEDPFRHYLYHGLAEKRRYD